MRGICWVAEEMLASRDRLLLADILVDYVHCGKWKWGLFITALNTASLTVFPSADVGFLSTVLVETIKITPCRNTLDLVTRNKHRSGIQQATPKTTASHPKWSIVCGFPFVLWASRCMHGWTWVDCMILRFSDGDFSACLRNWRADFIIVRWELKSLSSVKLSAF
jgi:hypothetical protein